jgi:hypothetical protein
LAIRGQKDEEELCITQCTVVQAQAYRLPVIADNGKSLHGFTT